MNHISIALMTLSLAVPVSAQTVYTLTNQPSGNSVLVFARGIGGALSLRGSFLTGGTGAGTGVDPLGSQGSVVLDRSGRLLFAVNAGSNDISTFAVDGDNLDLINRVASGGNRPVSIAVHGSLVYVLNAGRVPNVAGFTIDHRTNALVPMAGSERNLGGGEDSNPAEVAFNDTGEVLMVTEKGTQTIDLFTVNNEGLLSEPFVKRSSGSTPFGFQPTHHDLAIVSEAGPNALSSYRVDESENLDLITGSLANGQAGACWAVITEDGRFAFTVNAGSGTLSSYSVAADGKLSLLNAVAASTGAGSVPTDAALTRSSRFLYVRLGGLGQIQGFRIEDDGRLTPISSIGGVPPGSQGLAAR